MTTAQKQDSISFSVVIPVYNRASVISETLDSIKTQSYRNFEVIIVDDCSNDSPQLQAVLERYQQYFSIQYIRHNENLHGAAARNTGIHAAKNDYIALLDSDDLWVKNKLEVCANYFSNNPDIDIVTSQILTTEHGKQIKAPKFPRSPNVSVADYLLYQFGSMQTSSMVIRKDVAQRVLFDASLKRFQDYDFAIALDLAKCNYGYIEQPLVIMTENDQGNRISNSTNLEPLIVWMRKIKPLTSARAYETFKVIRYVRCLLANNKRIDALRELFCLQTIMHSRKKVWLKMFIACITPSAMHRVALRLKRVL